MKISGFYRIKDMAFADFKTQYLSFHFFTNRTSSKDDVRALTPRLYPLCILMIGFTSQVPQQIVIR